MGRRASHRSAARGGARGRRRRKRPGAGARGRSPRSRRRRARRAPPRSRAGVPRASREDGVTGKGATDHGIRGQARSGASVWGTSESPAIVCPEPVSRSAGSRVGPGALALVGVVVVAAALHSSIGSRNFTGWDEWLVLDLASRGILGFPHANRPLALLWVRPAPWLGPTPFDGFHLLHGVYMCGIGASVWLVARRLLAGSLLPFAAGVLAAVWAPGDPHRLATVLTASTHIAAGFLTTAAMAALVEAWCRRSRALLLAGSGLAFVAVRSYEPTAVLLAGAPLVLALLDARSGALRWSWGGGFLLGVAAGALLALVPPSGAAGEQLYRAGAALDLQPFGVAVRLLAQVRALLFPAAS